MQIRFAGTRRFFALLAAVVLVAYGGACRYGQTGSGQGDHVAGRPIQQVQEEHTDAWMALPGVVGTAVGQQKGAPCILVLTASDTEQVRRTIPSVVEGYPVVVRHIGEIRAQDE